MNQSFYAASVAVSQQQKRLNVTANNLANVNNAGFKAEKAQFTGTGRDPIMQPCRVGRAAA